MIGTFFLLTLTAHAAGEVKFECKLSSHTQWKDVLNFYKESKPGIKYAKKELGAIADLQVTNLDFVEVGEIIAGPCKGAKAFVGTYDSVGDCGKYGGQDYLIYSAQDIVIDRPGDSKIGDCSASTNFLKFGNHYIFRNGHTADSFRSALNAKDPGSVTISDESSNYDKLLIKDTEIKIGGSMIKVAVPDRDHLSDVRVQSFEGMAKVYSDDVLGSIYLKGRDAFLKTFDMRVGKIVLELGDMPAGYSFVGVLNDMQMYKFTSGLDVKFSDLLPVETSNDRYVIRKDHPLLKREHSMYLERVAMLKATIPELSTEANAQRSFESLSFNEYVEKEPFIFQKDKLGRIQIFSKELHSVPDWVEPILYVYTQKPIDMQIHFGQEVSITTSIPIYDNGWSIRTIPPNRFRNRRNGMKYRTLYWEGKTKPLPLLESGWILKPDEVATFFDRELAARGLVRSEINDFKSYWVPRLKDGPYYRIEFLPDEIVNLLCPIKIYPRPDTLVRVHMRVFLEAKSQALQAPERPHPILRKGTTVVEWGGIVSTK